MPVLPSMPAQSGGTTALSKTDAIAQAAQKYNIPVSILTGVWGVETTFGQNAHTSSAGAVGDFQFLPSTARRYGYPLTNTPTAAQFQQQADATAHYLSDLLHHTGSWDAALKSYSGGGYGLAKVQATSGQAPATAGSTTGPSPIPGVVSAIESPFQSVGRIADLLTSGDFWLRLGEAIAGVVLIVMGLRSLTGNTTTPISVARAAARHAPIPV